MNRKKKKKKPLGNSAEHSGGTPTLGTNLNPNLYALNYCLMCAKNAKPEEAPVVI